MYVHKKHTHDSKKLKHATTAAYMRVYAYCNCIHCAVIIGRDCSTMAWVGVVTLQQL